MLKFLEVMGDGRGGEIEAAGDIADGASAPVLNADVVHVIREAAESSGADGFVNGESLRVGERLKEFCYVCLLVDSRLTKIVR